MIIEPSPEGGRFYLSDLEYDAALPLIREISIEPFSVEHLGKYRHIFETLSKDTNSSLTEICESGITSTNVQNVFSLKTRINTFIQALETIDTYHEQEASSSESPSCPIISFGSVATRGLKPIF